MKIRNAKLPLILAALLLGPAAASAQAPANATGICKDGTYSTAASKDGACRGHKGVQTWYSPAPAQAVLEPATSKPTPAPIGSAPTQTATSSTPAPTPAPAKSGIAAERAKLATTPAAPGGGPGLVWLNGSSNVYHCPTSEFYGKTKSGTYLPEAEAKARGAHPNHNKPCA